MDLNHAGDFFLLLINSSGSPVSLSAEMLKSTVPFRFFVG